jgi:hypothetical protein
MYIVQSKDNVFGKFKDLKLLVENQAEIKIKSLRIGHGEFYTSDNFQTFLKDHGISFIVTNQMDMVRLLLTQMKSLLL